jgi:hypothetical protein
MGREKRPLNPVEAHRRSQKRKVAEKKRVARKELLSRTPLARRDPSILLVEIEKLRDLECEGRLDGPGRLKRKHLEEQFVALNKAREKAGLLTMHISEFDPEEYLARKKSELEIGRKQDYHENMKAKDITLPWPDDEPYEIGVPGLPPYLDQPLVENADSNQTPPKTSTKTELIIAAESSVPQEAHLKAQVDQFLNELDL